MYSRNVEQYEGVGINEESVTVEVGKVVMNVGRTGVVDEYTVVVIPEGGT